MLEESAPGEGNDVEAERVRFFERTGVAPGDLAAWLERAGCATEWFEELLAMEARYHRACRDALTADRCERALHARRLGLTRIELETVTFPSADAAREAYLCATEDGEPLDQCAQRSAATVSRSAWLVEDLPAELQDSFFSAAPGEMFPPMEAEDEAWIYRIRGKVDPGLGDPEVRRRVERVILDAHFESLVQRHVRWTCPSGAAP
jgi:hypothetical protein